MSYNAIQESEKSEVPAESKTCAALLAEVPSGTSRILISDYAPGKEFAKWDNDSDGIWESLCVPVFPRERQKISSGYNAVLVYFKNVPDQEAISEILESGEFEVNFWPRRQNLDVATHSMLAQKYANLDFSRSPVLHYGFEAGNPILGQNSLMASAAIGTLGLLVGFLSMVVGFFMKKPSRTIDLNKDDEVDENKPMTNRAGLPTDGDDKPESIFDKRDNDKRDNDQSTSIFDQVTSLRSQ